MEKHENILSFLLLIYGVVLAFFHIMPAFLGSFMKKPLTWGDTLDFFTPFVAIPFAFILYSTANKYLQSSQISSKSRVLFSKIILAIGFILYVNGHGIHLSANSIARLITNREGSVLFKSTYLFDEIISHFMWDGGVYFISIGLLIFAFKLSFGSLSGKNVIFIFLGAAFYGFTFTVSGIEGQTVIFTFPAAILCFLVLLYLHLKSNKKVGKNPFFLYFMIAYLISALLFAYWGISRSGFPQFSDLGWI